MINFSVSRPPRALILGGQVKKSKKQFCPFRFCQCWVRGGRFPKFPPFVQFSRRREEGVIKNYLSSSFLLKPFPRTSGSVYP